MGEIGGHSPSGSGSLPFTRLACCQLGIGFLDGAHAGRKWKERLQPPVSHSRPNRLSERAVSQDGAPRFTLKYKLPPPHASSDPGKVANERREAHLCHSIPLQHFDRGDRIIETCRTTTHAKMAEDNGLSCHLGTSEPSTQDLA